MNLSVLDWTVIAAYFLFNLGIGLYYARATGSTSEFFLSGRDVPWWLAGTSMVATTFAADTPLAVTGFVARNGIAGNWLWWNFVMSGMLTVFLYARLWRRAGVMTDIEFAELRYSGKPAAFPARLSRALSRPADQLHHPRLGKPGDGEDSARSRWELSKTRRDPIVIGMLLFTAFYTTISGLWGVLVTDLFQFVLKMGMVIVLAILAVQCCWRHRRTRRRRSPHSMPQPAAGSRLAFFPRTRFGLDARDHAVRLSRSELVGQLVSRR